MPERHVNSVPLNSTKLVRHVNGVLRGEGWVESSGLLNARPPTPARADFFPSQDFC
jgi:hypothetical protein